MGSIKIAPHFLTQDGFTLLEAMIAMVIIAIGFVGLQTLMLTSIGSNATSSIITESTTWATATIEDIMSWEYNDDRLVDDQPAGSAEGWATSPDGLYTISYFVTDDTPITNAKTVDINVAWTRGGTAYTTDFSTVIPKQ